MELPWGFHGQKFGILNSKCQIAENGQKTGFSIWNSEFRTSALGITMAISWAEVRNRHVHGQKFLSLGKDGCLDISNTKTSEDGDFVAKMNGFWGMYLALRRIFEIVVYSSDENAHRFISPSWLILMLISILPCVSPLQEVSSSETWLQAPLAFSSSVPGSP